VTVSTFGGLNIASSSLAAQRRAIETAGHNVANANTAGYSRQRVDLAARASGSVGIHTGTSLQPGGVAVVSQTRISDAFVVSRLHAEGSRQGSTDVLRETLAVIEAAFDEPGETGLAAQLEGFYDAWDAVVTRPEDLAVRTSLLQKAGAVADSMNALHQRISAVADGALQRAEAAVVDVNSLTTGIAQLNRVIAEQTAIGQVSGESLDQRDQLIGQLARYVGVQTRTGDDGMVTVSVGGSNLVSGGRSTAVSLDTSVPGAAVLRLDGAGTALRPAEGEIPALLRVADVEVPAQLARLDAVALSLVQTVNDQHALGQTLHDPPVAAGAFFTATGAADLALAFSDPQLVGAAALGAGRYDGGNARAMANLAGLPGGPDALYRATVAELGVQANAANGAAGLQDEVVGRLVDQRDAISGVSIDEEMTNLVAYQQAYQASARYLTAVDEMLDTLINGTGLVGR
jgi:flagellar hook-associated protein 1 FlgK